MQLHVLRQLFLSTSLVSYSWRMSYRHTYIVKHVYIRLISASFFCVSATKQNNQNETKQPDESLDYVYMYIGTFATESYSNLCIIITVSGKWWLAGEGPTTANTRSPRGGHRAGAIHAYTVTRTHALIQICVLPSPSHVYTTRRQYHNRTS